MSKKPKPSDEQPAAVSVEDLVSERARVKEHLEALSTRLRDIDTQLLAAATPGDVLRGPTGDPVYKISVRRTFSTSAAQTLIAQGLAGPDRKTWKHLARLVTVDTIDGTALKQAAPDVWAQACRTGQPYITSAR